MSNDSREPSDEYMRLAHAIQSGVMHEHAQGSPDGSPKHLRVGVNLTSVSVSALVSVLIAKGVITFPEYEDALVVEMQAELDRYHDRNPGVRFA